MKDEVADTLFDEVASDADADAWRKGSAHVALETAPPFAEYVFIEHAPDHAQELDRLRGLYPLLSQRIGVVGEDANTYLRKWCAATDWNKTRAVIFLDPYGMQVEWTTIAARHQVEILHKCLTEQSLVELITVTGRSDRTKFRHQVLGPLLKAGLLEMTIPGKPRSSRQRYRTTPLGRAALTKGRQES